MAITNTDTLPGVRTDIADHRLTVSPILPGTRVTVLGTTTSTHLNELEPIVIDNIPLGLRRLRHTDGAPSELSIAVAELSAGGARNIEVVKVATLSGELGPNTYSANDRFDDYENAYQLLLLHDVDVLRPIGAWLDETGLSGTSPEGITRSTGFGRQAGDFCHQATKRGNSAIAVIGVRPLMSTAAAESWAGAPTDRTGELFNEPSLAYLQEWTYHLRSEAGTLVDHSSETALDSYIAGSEEQTYGTVSSAYTFWARDEDGSTAVDKNGNNVDGGGYLSVTAMAVRAITDETQNLANRHGVPAQTSYNAQDAGANGYAALITRLEPHEATTNKTMPGFIPARRVPASLAEELLAVRMVTMVDRSGSTVVSSGCTGAHNASRYTRSDFVRLTTRRIVNAAVDIVRSQGDRFIGLPITGPHMNALEQAIATGLDKMRPSGAVQSYQLNIISSPDDQVLGEVTVKMALVIGHELLTINLDLQLAKGESIA